MAENTACGEDPACHARRRHYRRSLRSLGFFPERHGGLHVYAEWLRLFDFDEPLVFFIADYAAAFLLFAIAGFALSLMRKRP